MELERRSLKKLADDQAEATRYRTNALATEPLEQHASTMAKWRKAHETAQAQHQARLAYYDAEYLGRKALKPSPRPPQPSLRLNHEDSPIPVEQEAPEDHTRHAKFWLDRHLEEIEAAASLGTGPRKVGRYDFFGPDGIREQYLTKLAREAAERDGHIFMENF
jgi:hypothetical protein